ncbi:hypothetical protein SETIT_7G015500v2 [Setaria italica]|uniref:Uncharacterized protein n=1 Tax=Setaria italica TaxID=4555 RepID=A0A368RQZ7_SETIT|nr:mediator of RNA polymerase II transcription subunit 15a isoform X2 [Setaria italica]RCV32592.1 hypothetical protein SETIT_7G015500v2 [Setaria italica]
MQDGAAAGGMRPWRQDLDSLLRPRVIDTIARKLAQVYHGQLDSTQDLNRVAASFENKVFHEANSKGDYLRRISVRLVSLKQKQKQKLLQRISGHQQQIQAGSDMRQINAVHAIHGGNSSITAMPQVTSMMSTHGRQSSQLQSLPMTPPGSGLVPNQNVSYPFAPNMHVNVKQEQLEVTGKPDQIRNSCHASVSPFASGVQLSQQMVQSVASQNLKQLALQMQPTNFSGGNPISTAHQQRQPLDQANVQEQMMANQQGLGFNQQQDRLKYQILVEQQANVTNTNNSHPGAQNNHPGITVGFRSMLKMHEQEALNEHIKMEPQPVSLLQPLITVSQQNSSFSTMGRAGEVDWREDMFQQIKPLKDAHLSELMELNQVLHVPKLTEKQFESLPKDKAGQYIFRVNLKKRTTLVLNFLLLEKCNIPDNYRGQFSMFLKSIKDLVGYYRKSKNRMMDARDRPQIFHGQPQIINLSGDQAPSGGSPSHQKQQEQLVHSQLRENIISTTSAAQEMNHNHLFGVARSCFPEKSRGSLQSLPIDKRQECCTLTPSPISKSGVLNVSSPSASLKSTTPSPDATPGAAKAEASSSVSVKFTLPSPVTTSGVVKVSSSYASVNSTFPSAIAESATIQAATPCASANSALPSPFAKSGVIEATSSVTNSGCAPFALPCPSMHSTSSEDIESLYALLLQDNSDPSGAQAAVGGTAIKTVNVSKQVTTTKPIMQASPIEAETADHQAEDNLHPRNEILVAKKPIDRLLDAVRISSPSMLCSAANSVYSVLNMNDWVPPREIDAFQYSQQGGSNTVKKMKRVFESTSLCSESAPLGSMDGSCMTFDWTVSEAEYSGERGAKRQKVQNAKDTLLDEINSVNNMLLDTFISIAQDNGTDGMASGNGGTLIELFYTAISLTPDLASLFATSGMSIVMPVKVLVPVDYPRSSPVLVCDQGDEQMRKRFSEISGAADVAFRRTLYGLQEPMSVVDMARAWDASVRRSIVDFAQRHGGGMFSSRYGEWTWC